MLGGYKIINRSYYSNKNQSHPFWCVVESHNSREVQRSTLPQASPPLSGKYGYDQERESTPEKLLAF
jgi:hypothetical protein